ncbi:hypothetical protein B0H16DRAFT_1743212 [Mycena metata]|uniref:DUF7330 domain-containing protein n=1 Tax=Mycena metata TaxID=1033252 RepID=A0AAD7MEM1_9AGAR|nr:hypothetical protein B0H16DRAFT_1743212 [Mycena metata]
MPTTRATTAPKDDSPPAEQQLAPPTTPVTVKPTNFLFVKRDSGAIRGTYVIDPRIKIPRSMLPPLAAGETEATRQNLFLDTNSGSIDVDISVLGDTNTKRSVNMSLRCSDYGSITVKLHVASTARPPIYIQAKTIKDSGRITLHLPRTFRGPVTIKQTSKGDPLWGRISIGISEHLMAGMMPLSEANGTWHYFVGTPEGWTDDGKWEGDAACLESGGNVRLQYDGEPDPPASSSCLVC